MAADWPQLSTLSNSSRIAQLSHLALPAEATPTKNTERDTTPTLNSDRVLPNLLRLLSSLSSLTCFPNLSSLSTSEHHLVFLLSLLHCALHSHCRLTGRPTPRLSLLSSSLSLLCTLSQGHPPTHEDTAETLREHVLALYSPVCSGLVLQGLVTSCLSSSTVAATGSKLSLALGECGDIEVVTPGPEVPLENYRDHVMGVMSSEIEEKTDLQLRYILCTLYSAHRLILDGVPRTN